VRSPFDLSLVKKHIAMLHTYGVVPGGRGGARSALITFFLLNRVWWVCFCSGGSYEFSMKHLNSGS